MGPQKLRRSASSPDLGARPTRRVSASNQTDPVPHSNQALLAELEEAQADERAHEQRLTDAKASQVDMMPELYDAMPENQTVLSRGRMMDELKDKGAPRQRQLDRRADARQEGRLADVRVLPDAYDAMGLGTDEKDDLNTMMWGAQEAAFKTRAYHATRTRNMDSILEHGLDPDFGGSGAAKGDAGYEEQSANKVHFTHTRNHAERYKEYYEKGVFPLNSSKTTDDLSEGEVLKLTIPKQLNDRAQKDPDDNYGRTVDKKIDPDLIRRSAPVPLPGERDESKKAEYEQTWMEHDRKGKLDRDALLSNMDAQTKALVMSYPEDQRDTVLQMIKQGLGSAPHALRNNGQNAWE